MNPGIVATMGSRVILLLAISLFVSNCAHRDASPAPTSSVAQTTFTSADVERALSDAEQFRSEGKYEQSLERHIWYHQNALTLIAMICNATKVSCPNPGTCHQLFPNDYGDADQPLPYGSGCQGCCVRMFGRGGSLYGNCINRCI